MNINMFSRTAVAIAALAVATTPVWAAGERTVKEVNVTAEVTHLTGSNAKQYYPDIANDILERIVEKMPLTDDTQGYVVNVNIQNMSLDGDTMLPDSREFNRLEGVMSVIAPDTNAGSESYPIRIVAQSAESAVPDGYVAVSPSNNDFYVAMIDGFAEQVAMHEPETMPQAASK